MDSKNTALIMFAAISALVPALTVTQQQNVAAKPGETIDPYNINVDHGSLTNADISQLSIFIQHNSEGRAVIVTGDFNVRYPDEHSTALHQFATDNGLTDSWTQLESHNPAHHN